MKQEEDIIHFIGIDWYFVLEETDKNKFGMRVQLILVTDRSALEALIGEDWKRLIRLF